MAYVLIKFANSPRPDLWVLERSMDFGRTYQPWQFFACESLPPRGLGGEAGGSLGRPSMTRLLKVSEHPALPSHPAAVVMTVRQGLEGSWGFTGFCPWRRAQLGPRAMAPGISGAIYWLPLDDFMCWLLPVVTEGP